MAARERDEPGQGGRLAGILPTIMRDRGWETQLDLHSLFPRWRRIVGEELAGYTAPLKIVKQVLWLEVENSAWLQQLQYQKVTLLETLNRELRLSSLRDIRFVLATPETRREKEAATLRFVAPDPEELRCFEQQVASIADKEIREGLVRLWYLSKACVREEDKGPESGEEK